METEDFTEYLVEYFYPSLVALYSFFTQVVTRIRFQMNLDGRMKHLQHGKYFSIRRLTVLERYP